MREVYGHSVQPSWQPTISAMVPSNNEELGLVDLHQRLLRALDGDQDIQVEDVNDGSSDGTLAIMDALHCAGRIGPVSLSRNFGKEIAITVGLDFAMAITGSNLRDISELIPELVAKWRVGLDMMYPNRRNGAGVAG